MCTLVTISKAVWDAAPVQWAGRLQQDSRANPHGVAALLAKPDGSYTSIRTQDVDVVIGTLATAEWARVWVHSRWGTGGANTLENTHGFCAGGVWYMHNGFIRQAPASSMPVDSMAIGKWISEGTVYDKLFRESYANVFLIAPHSGVWTTVRGGPGGQLHTDGQGNFSTIAEGAVSQPVLPGTKLSFQCPKHVEPRWGRPSATTPRVGRRREVPEPGQVFRNMSEYWAAVNADLVEFDFETYKSIADKVYHD